MRPKAVTKCKRTGQATRTAQLAIAGTMALVGFAGEVACQDLTITLGRDELNRILDVRDADSLRVVDPDGRWTTLEEFGDVAIWEQTLFTETARPEIEPRELPEGLTYFLPNQLKRLDFSARETITFDAVVRPSPEQLTFDPVSGEFTTTLHVGLRRTGNNSAPVPIHPAYPVHLSADVALVEGVEGGSVRLDETGLYKEVSMRLREPRETVIVSITPGGDRTRRVELRVNLPQISVEVSPNPIWGFGLATATIAIRAPGARARNVESLTPGYDRGRMEGSDSVPLDSDGSGTAVIRSGGLGIATIEVEHSHYVGGVDTVEFVWPIGFLVACLIGGFLGGLIRFWRLPESDRSLGGALMRGCVSAVIVAVAAATGINLLGIDIGEGTSEAFVFVVSALGAIMGVQKPAPASAPA